MCIGKKGKTFVLSSKPGEIAVCALQKPIQLDESGKQNRPFGRKWTNMDERAQKIARPPFLHINLCPEEYLDPIGVFGPCSGVVGVLCRFGYCSLP